MVVVAAVVVVAHFFFYGYSQSIEIERKKGILPPLAHFIYYLGNCPSYLLLHTKQPRRGQSNIWAAKGGHSVLAIELVTTLALIATSDAHFGSIKVNHLLSGSSFAD